MAKKKKIDISSHLDFIIDIETTRLPSGATRKAPKALDGTILGVTIDQAKESHVKPVGIAIIDKEKAMLQALTISGIETPTPTDINIHGEFDTKQVFYGKEQKVKMFTGSTQSRLDIENLFKENTAPKTNKEALVDHYFNKVHKRITDRIKHREVYYAVTGAQGKQALVSSFSKRYFKHTVEELHNISLEGISKFIKIDKKSAIITLDQLQSKFVNEFAYKIIEAANKKGAVDIGAWNAQFESERISGWIELYAKENIKEDWFKLLGEQKIRFKSMESSYINVMFGLAKEDKDLLQSMRIPLHAEFFEKHGFRAGAIPRTIEELADAVPWSQDFVSQSISGWLKKMQSTEGIEGHLAPIDTVRSDIIKEFFDEIQNEAARILKNKYNTDITNMDDFFQLMDAEHANGRTIMHEAFESVVRKKSGKNEISRNVSAKELIKDFKDIVKETSTRRSDVIKDILGHIAKESKQKSVTGGIRPPKGPLTHQYGVLAAFAGLAIAGTYLGSGSDDEIEYGKKFGSIGDRKLWDSNLDEDESASGPYLHRNLLKFTKNVGLTFAGISAVGYRAGKLLGNPLGFRDKFSLEEAIEDPTKLLKQAGKLFRFGIREIEDHFHIARVLKVGASIDYITGDISKTGIQRTLTSTVKDINSPARIGDLNIDSFLDAIKLSNPEASSKLVQAISAAESDPLYESVRVTISQKEKQTAVNVQTFKDGVYDKMFNEDLVFDVETMSLRTNRANIAGRGIHPSDRKTENTFNRVKSAIVEDYSQAETSRMRNYQKATFEEFKSLYPDTLTGNQFFDDIFRKIQYHLELAPKGVNQVFNAFEPITEDRKILPRRILAVKDIGGEAEALEALKVKGRYWGTFGSTFIQSANKFLEAPFELMINPQTIERTIKRLKESKSSVVRFAGKTLGVIEKPHLGLNINEMKYGTPEYLGKFALKRILPAAAAYQGVKLVDSLIGGALFTESGRGPITAGPNILYQKASLAYSKISDILGLTTVAKKQEDIAPGSTGLGFFALPATLAGGYAITQGLLNKAPKHLQAKLGKEARIGKTSLVEMLLRKASDTKVLQEALKKEAFKGALNKSIPARLAESFIRAPKSTLFKAGMALMSPFSLGLLGSTKTYQERKAEFAGQKDVAIKRNRGWVISPQPITGEGISSFRQHGSYIYGSNYENQGVVWPSYTSRLLHSMTLGLSNRYILEEYHKESQPVLETAPYGASVPLVGPIISKSLGWLMKPVKQMHTEHVTGFSGDIEGYTSEYSRIAYKSHSDAIDETSDTYNALNYRLPEEMSFSDIQSVNKFTQHGTQFASQLTELSGFKGFFSSSIYKAVAGKELHDFYTPYKKSALEMYNPAQQMWQYEAGDFAFPGGEFMRRGLQNPRKRWELGNVPNELYGQTWLPKKYQTGTTFDQMPMGWLYASRKGWEFQYGDELRGLQLDQYPEHIKLDILKYMAPESPEFSSMAQQVNMLSRANQLSPFDEQRAYDAIEQSHTLKYNALGATSRKDSRRVKEKEINGIVTSLDLHNMTFTVDSTGGRKMRLAGVSTDINDIRAKLLKTNKYKDNEQLSKDADDRQQEILSIIEKQMSIGSKVSISVADTDEGEFSGKGTQEAIVGSLNRKLIDAGSPLIDTGNLSQYNLSQRYSPIGSTLMSSYWQGATTHMNMFGRKMLAERDYLEKYKREHVYNRRVKLWDKPLEHFVYPSISSIANDIGISLTPASVKKQRKNEQYWDIIKYIKYKKLQSQSDSLEESQYYQSLADQTMVGADPINDREGTREAMQYNKRDYFDYFANEPDKKKRGKIMKVLSEPEKRIFSSIWTSNLAKGGNKKLQDKYRLLRASGGYDVNDKIIREFDEDTEFSGDLKEYVRARYISQFMKKNKLPGLDWEGWSEEVDLDNTQIHSLLGEGQQVQDYGYFDMQKRQAAYDRGAYLAAQTLRSSRLTSSDFTGTVLPALMSGSKMASANMLPTDSPYPISSTVMITDSYSRQLQINHNIPQYAQNGISGYFL